MPPDSRLSSSHSHWVNSVLGARFRQGGQGPEEFDCWGMVRFLYRLQRGIELPLLGIAYEDLDRRARAFESLGESEGGLGIRLDRVERPSDLDCVIMRRPRMAHPHHIGVWADSQAGMIVHALEDEGVVVDTRQTLKMRGIRIIEFIHAEV